MYFLSENGILEFRFFIATKRDQKTLLSIIIQEIKPGPTVHSDEWKTHNILKTTIFFTKLLSHSKNIINPHTGAQTQTIKCLWRHIKLKCNIRSCEATNLLKRQLHEEW